MSITFSLNKKPTIVTRWLLALTIVCSVCFGALKVLKFYGVPSYEIYHEPAPLANNAEVQVEPAPKTLAGKLKRLFNRHFVYQKGPIEGDSWRPMILALEHIKKQPEGSVYNNFFNKGVKFQYPLTSLLLFDLPERLFGIPYGLTVYFIRLLSLASIFIVAYISFKILIDILASQGFKEMRIPASEKPLVIVLIVALTILFYPIYKGYSLGQIQVLLTLMTTLSLLCWQRDKKILTGVLIALICLVKPQLGLLFLWGIFRKQWNMVLGGAAVLAIFAIISLALYGLNSNLEYLRILSFLSERGEAFYANQSVNGLINRLLFNGQNLVWDLGFPPYSPIVHMYSMISSAILIIGGLLWNFKRKPHILDLCIMITCATIASPIAWEHHYAVLFPVFIIISPFALYYYGGQKNWVLAVLGSAYLLTSLYFEITKSVADSAWNILQSYLFFGAILLLVLLMTVSIKFGKLQFKSSS